MKKINIKILHNEIKDFENIIKSVISQKSNSNFSKFVNFLIGEKNSILLELLLGTIDINELKNYFYIFKNNGSYRKTKGGIKLKLLMEDLYKFSSQKLTEKYIQLYSKNEILICPYCNINEISSYYKVQLDHFKDKSKNYHLSICLSNIVLVCSICNGPKIKHTKSITQNPYNIDFYTRFNFKILFKNGLISNISCGDFSDIDIEKDLKVLKYKEIYNSPYSIDKSKAIYLDITTNKDLMKSKFYDKLGENIKNKYLSYESEILKYNKIEYSKLFVDIKNNIK